MAVISKGQTFATGDQVTALKLNNLADNATFAPGSVDNVSTQLAGGAIIVKDGGVTFAKLTDVIDDDTMATASATKLATSESIKAYVDASANFTPSTYAGEESVTLPNGLIMKWGIKYLSSSVGTIIFATPFPTAVVNVQGHLHGADAFSNLGVTSYNTAAIGVNPASAGTYHWQAIGY